MKWCLYAYLLSLRKAKASYSRYLVEGCRVCLRSDTVKCWMKELHVKPGLSCGRLGICIHQKMGFHTTLRNNGWWVSDVHICVPSRGERENQRLRLTWSHEPPNSIIHIRENPHTKKASFKGFCIKKQFILSKSNIINMSKMLFGKCWVSICYIIMFFLLIIVLL